MRSIATNLFLVILTLCVVMLPDVGYTSENEENSVKKLFSIYGKNTVSKIIYEKRNGKITIEKYRSFVDTYGKPDLSLITAKSVVHDLGILGIGEDELALVLRKRQKQQLMETKEVKKDPARQPSNKKSVPLSEELRQKINATKERYKKSRNNMEKKRLRNELSILRSAYKRARKNERSKLNVYSPKEKKKKRYNSKSNSSGCLQAKDQLQKLSSPVSRHQVYFCSDRQYKKENPISCEGGQYSRQYDQKRYKQEISRLTDQVASRCRN